MGRLSRDEEDAPEAVEEVVSVTVAFVLAINSIPVDVPQMGVWIGGGVTMRNVTTVKALTREGTSILRGIDWSYDMLRGAEWQVRALGVGEVTLERDLLHDIEWISVNSVKVSKGDLHGGEFVGGAVGRQAFESET